MPQPSARALLKNLVELGYLQFDPAAKTYFPTMRIAGLGNWISRSFLGGVDVARLVDDIANETGETTSLATMNEQNLEIVYTRTAAHPLALRLRPGIGESLWMTAAGRTLLSTLTDDTVESLLQAMIRQERSPRNRQQIAALPALLNEIRDAGYYAGYDTYLEGVGAVCVSTAIGEHPAVVAVAGVKDRIRANEQQIVWTVQARLRRFPL